MMRNQLDSKFSPSRPRPLAIVTGLCGALAAGACGDNLQREIPDEEIPPAPVLSQQELWILEGDGGDCFGAGGVTTGDLDGDQIDDLIVTSPDCWFLTGGTPTGPRIAVYRGTPTGYEEPPFVHMFEDMGPRFGIPVGAADLNGDGRDDLTVNWFTFGDVFLGAESFEAMFATRYDGVGSHPVFLDFDGDGRDEALINGAVLAWDDAAGGLANVGALTGRPSRAGDANGDGLDDLYVNTSEGVKLYLGCRACPDGTPQGPIDVPVDVAPEGIGDVNGDGRGDAVIRSVSETVSLHLAGEDGVLLARPLWTIYPDWLYGRFGTIAKLGDVNGDGRDGDIAVTLLGRTMMLLADEDGPAAAPAWEWASGYATDPDFVLSSHRPVISRDFNGDGYLDVLIHAYGRFRAFSGGVVPEGTPAPYLPDGFSCDMGEGALPDLTSDRELMARSLRIRSAEFTAESCEVQEACVGGTGTRRLLDFTVAVQNLGGGAAILPGSSIDPTLWEFDACHGHDHLVGFADYALLDAQGQTVVAGHKQGYFLIDVAAYCDVAPEEPPSEFFEYLFISPGWADIYYAGLECQWIDITGIPDGSYRLRVSVNASGVFDEDDRHPNDVELQVEIAGDEVTVAP